jgi:polar amino acid transport system substrate-binding protein
MKHLLTVLLAIIILALTSVSALAQEIIVPLNHFPPWRIVDKNYQVGGINVELMNALLRKLDLKATYVIRPWKRAQRMIKNGSADIMNGLLKSQARAKDMIFLDPPYKTQSSKAFYTLKSKPIKINTYEDLYKYKIGITLGSKFFPRFDSDTKLSKDMCKDASTNFKKLERGRIDTIILTETVGDYLLHKLNYQDKMEKEPYVYSEPLSVYFAVSKKSFLTKRGPELNAALKKMVESGEVRSIIDNFMARQKNYQNNPL